MARTLLFGSPAHSWKQWIETNQGKRDLVILDPYNGEFGAAAIASRRTLDGPTDARLIGTLNATKRPLEVLGAATLCTENSLVLCHEWKAAPVLRSLAFQLAHLLQPTEILYPSGAEMELEGWPVGPEPVEIDKSMPEMVKQAQRRAHWIEMNENASLHEVILGQVGLQGARLGSGIPLMNDLFWTRELKGVIYAEIANGILNLVVNERFEPDQAGTAMNYAHAQQIHTSNVDDFDHLICSLNRQNGEPLAFGFIERAELNRNRLIVRSQMIPGAPIRSLSIGLLKVDGTGKELGELKPWQV